MVDLNSVVNVISMMDFLASTNYKSATPTEQKYMHSKIGNTKIILVTKTLAMKAQQTNLLFVPNYININLIFFCIFRCVLDAKRLTYEITFLISNILRQRFHVMSIIFPLHLYLWYLFLSYKNIFITPLAVVVVMESLFCFCFY